MHRFKHLLVGLKKGTNKNLLQAMLEAARPSAG